jgi:6-phosphogluconolactonase
LLAARQPADKVFTVALSGGRITKTFFDAVVAQATSQPGAMAGVHFFWADERCVPPQHADSNFLLAQTHLLAPLNIPADQIHRLRGEADPAFAVAEADAELCRVADLGADGMPQIDLVFLGVGEDGHVASLFPGATPEVGQARGPFLHITDSPKPPPRRLTLTYVTLAAARDVWVLASGAGKAAVLAESLSPAGHPPLARVIQARTRTSIFTDLGV